MYKIGDRVRWRVQGGDRTIEGVVVAVVPPAEDPMLYLPRKHRPQSDAGFGKLRDHESYLVCTEHGEEAKRDRVHKTFWPRVGWMEEA
jgi:hypothetical protein